MKFVLAFAVLLFAGCANQLPPGSCESATFSLNVGPFFTQKAQLAGVSKQPDGTLRVSNFDGSTSYLGVFNTEQTAHDLVIQPKQTPAPASTAAPAAK